MKKEEIYRALEYVRDDYIESAADVMTGKAKRRRFGWQYAGVAAACMVLAVASVTLLLPLSVQTDGDGGVTTADSTHSSFDAHVTTPPLTQDEPPHSLIPKPMRSGEVEQWMEEHTLLNDKIDPNSYSVSANTEFWTNSGMSALFDDIFSKDEWKAAVGGEVGDTEHGMMTFHGTTAAFYWAMTEPVTLGSYVVYSGFNGEYGFVNPLGWDLYGLKEPIDVNAIDPEVFLSYDEDALIWMGFEPIDDVYISFIGLSDDQKQQKVDCEPYGYKIDLSNQGEYQYYCWFVQYGADVQNMTQVAGLKLYAAD